MIAYINKKRQQGQSTLEYAVLIIIIIGALLSIQIYIKRGIQGRLKQATDDIGSQFSPGNTSVNRNVSTTSNTSQTSHQNTGNATNIRPGLQELTNETMNSQVIVNDQEFWGKQPAAN